MLRAQAVLIIVRNLECAGGESIQADSEWTHGRSRSDAGARICSGTECGLKGLVGCRGGVDRAAAHSGRDGNSPYLSSQPAYKHRGVGRIDGGKISDLRRDDVVEHAKTKMHRGLMRKLIGGRNPRLVHKKRGCREVGAYAGLNHLIQGLVDPMGQIEKGSRWTCEQALLIPWIRIPGYADSGGERQLGTGL